VSLVTYRCEREWRRDVSRSQNVYLKILGQTACSKSMGLVEVVMNAEGTDILRSLSTIFK